MSSDVQPDVRAALRRVDKLFGSEIGHALSRLDAAVIRDVQLAAIRHPDPHLRRSCLWVLDHYANDESMHVFAAALDDDVHFVRDIALHSIACEGCKSDALCVADVVPPLVRVLEQDPKPDLRVKALTALMRLSQRDVHVTDAIRRAATTNSDREVRRCAADALVGRFVPPKKRIDRSQRRHAAIGHGTRSSRRSA